MTPGPVLNPEHDMTGKVVGCLHIDSRASNDVEGNARWTCTCVVCGRTQTVHGVRLRRTWPGRETCSLPCRHDVMRVGLLLRGRDLGLFGELMAEARRA